MNHRETIAWWREPLLHFLVIGAALFGLHRRLDRGEGAASREIVIGESRVAALEENFARTWSRPPTAQELRGLVDDYVAEEIYCREAVAIGLDRDDTVIRRRLRQKMEFIAGDAVAVTTPTDAELQAYLERHADAFAVPARLTFRQVFFGTDHRGEAAVGDAELLLARLRDGAGPDDPGEVGDPTLLPPAMASVDSREIAKTFGSDFAQAVERAPVGRWTGPVRSGFGAHLVRVEERVAGTVPPLAEIRAAVERDWEDERRRTAAAGELAKWRERYAVRLEGRAAEVYASTPAADRGDAR